MEGPKIIIGSIWNQEMIIKSSMIHLWQTDEEIPANRKILTSCTKKNIGR